jgi:hypothetical protein
MFAVHVAGGEHRVARGELRTFLPGRGQLNPIEATPPRVPLGQQRFAPRRATRALPRHLRIVTQRVQIDIQRRAPLGRQRAIEQGQQ